MDFSGVRGVHGDNDRHRCKIYEGDEQLGGLFPWRKRLKRLGSRAERTGFRYERLASDGVAGSGVCLWYGQAWIAIGLFIGTVCNWIFVSGRLRRYTIRANNSLTLPEYFENRFHDKKNILLCISSVFIVIFFLVYTASALAAGGKLFHAVAGIDYTIALTIGAAVILAYTFMGGFMAVCVTDFVRVR